MSWYYESAGRQAGPVDDTALAGLVNTGTVAGPTLVWRPGMAAWQPYQEIWAASAAAAANGQMPSAAGNGNGTATAAVSARAITPAEMLAGFGYCTECGRGNALDDLAPVFDRRVCGTCKPELLQRLREGALLPLATQRYAGFWVRVGAAMLDWLIQLPVNMGISFLSLYPFGVWNIQSAGGASGLRGQVLVNIVTQLLSVSFHVAYSTFFVGRFGATPGQLVCGLRVRRSDGSALTYRRALLRALAKLLNSFTLGLSYILVGIDPEKRGVHDYLCDTRVVFK